MRLRIWVLSFSLAVILSTPLAAKESSKLNADMEALQGEWSMTSGTTSGFPIPPMMRDTCKRICRGNEVTVSAGGQVILHSHITVDTHKTPHTIDYELIDGPDKGKVRLGIYAMQGETFLSCFGIPGGERPSDFTSKPGDMRVLSAWKRDKPAQ